MSASDKLDVGSMARLLMGRTVTIKAEDIEQDFIVTEARVISGRPLQAYEIVARSHGAPRKRRSDDK